MFSDDQAFALLKRRIFLDRGLDCEQYKENYLKRRIAVRLRATGAPDYIDYLRILRNDPEEYTKLMNELTINVTQFFRDPDVYSKLWENVLPDLIKSKKAMGSRTLRIWSAGCASGEEPYSMAILLEDILGEESKRWNIRVLGSDFDDRSLLAARQGAYLDLEMLKGLEPSKFFEIEQVTEGVQWQVKEEVKRRVKFEKLNLLAEEEPRHFDMVLCRNVLIYFGRKVQTRIIETLSKSILREGFLVLGKSETLGQDAAQAFRPIFPRERIYQLIGEDRARPVTRTEGSSRSSGGRNG
ncbi:MAG: CheR family methyltransferase [Candidatus Geothermincolia bacterium]